jgi:hypothetical protein
MKMAGAAMVYVVESLLLATIKVFLANMWQKTSRVLWKYSNTQLMNDLEKHTLVDTNPSFKGQSH